MKREKRKHVAWLLAGSMLFAWAASRTICAAEVMTIHVARNGSDTNAGTLRRPVATIEKALALIDAGPGSGEIVMHQGVYSPEKTVTIGRPRGSIAGDRQRTLTLRAADNEEVVFDGSVVIDDLARPLPGSPGVYTIQGDFPTDDPPAIWEESTDVHYGRMADLTAVKYKDQSCVVLDRTTLALRPAGGTSPKGVRMSRSNIALAVIRSNVTVKGLHFQHYNIYRASTAIQVGEVAKVQTQTGGLATGDRLSANLTRNTVVDSCRAFNCHKGFHVYSGGENTLITRCQVRNPVTGVHNAGLNTTVEHCTIGNDYGRIYKAPAACNDIFAVGVYTYYDGKHITIRNNLIKGFRQAIFTKTYPSKVHIEHNTILYGQPDTVDGISAVSLGFVVSGDLRVRRNIIVGYGDGGAAYPAGMLYDENVLWGPEANTILANVLARQRAQGVGAHNLLADPAFAAPQADDYRLLADSQAAGFEDGRPAGAFATMPADHRVPPRVRPEVVTIRGVQELDSLPPQGLPRFSCYTSRQRAVQVALWVVSGAPPVKTRFKIDDGPMQQRAFEPTDAFELPDRDGPHTISVQVQDAGGTWSEPSAVYVSLRRSGLQLVGEPTIVTNQHGALFSFKAASPGAAKLEYHNGANWVTAADSSYITDAGFPRRFREITFFPLLVANLPPNTPHKYRLTLSAPLGTMVKEGVFKLSGKPKILYVSTTGEDAEKGGSRERPLKTIQFALDRALPGDTVRILPGVYFGTQFLGHGGTEEHPLVIEGLSPNSVTLDALGQEAFALAVRKAPYVVLRNLNAQWFVFAGIGIVESAGTRVTQCRFHNQYWRTTERCIGSGLVIELSPDFTVDHCIFTRCYGAGLIFDGSPRGQVVHNTATACEGSLIMWRAWSGPSDGVSIQYNSLHFNGNQLLSIRVPKDTLLNKCVIDYNNYGTAFLGSEQQRIDWADQYYGKSIPLPFPYLPRNRELQYYVDTTDPKQPLAEAQHVSYSMEDWLKFSGQDKHSIFADPKWVDPRAGRFDVKADSPNLLPDGKVIGAVGNLSPSQLSEATTGAVVEKNPAKRPPPSKAGRLPKTVAEFRTWTDSTGRHKVEASFAGMAFGSVKLTQKDGSTIQLPLERLSHEDRRWIRSQKK